MRWTTAFLDLPAEQAADAAAFWQAVTGSGLSARRGERGQFATLLPPTGDAYLRVQTVAAGPAHCHLDLHSDDREGLAAAAEQLGATIVATVDDVEVLHSPGGLPFCAVNWDGETVRPPPVTWPGGASTVDQLCLDIPADTYRSEVAFWAALTGSQQQVGGLPEFRYLQRPDGIPLRLLLQRLDDPAPAVTAHLDLAADNVAHEVERHQAFGATVLRRMPHWTTLADPAGLAYCVTRRPATTGAPR